MILFFGDTHAEHRHVLPIVREHKPAAIIFLGDMEPEKPFHEELKGVMDLTEVWWIHGNHDVDKKSSYDHLFDSELADRNLDGRVVEIAGLKIAGLGGVFAGSIWYPRHDANEEPKYRNYDEAIDKMMVAERHKEMRRLKREGKEPDGLPSAPMIGKALLHKASIFPDTWENLGCMEADILVTHEAPTCHPYGFAAIDELGKAMGIKKLFHGHQHQNLAYPDAIEKLGYQAYCVALGGVMGIDGNVVRKGKERGEP